MVASAVEGLDALYLAETATKAAPSQILFVARDGERANQLAELVGYFAPDLAVAVLPAWDCLPYDRVSPNPDIMARRLDGLIGYLVNVKQQYPGSDQVAMLDQAIESLMRRQPRQRIRPSESTIRKG